MESAANIAQFYTDQPRPDWVPDSIAFDEWLFATIKQAIEADREQR